MTRLSLILAAMAAVALLELALPLHPRGRAGREHLAPNLALTGVALALNAALDAALAVALFALDAAGLGLLRLFALPPPLELAIALLALDLATYAAHVSMHALPAFWRFHRVHHADAAVDVTTTLRQHPGESAIRAAFSGACALALGVRPAALALYRAASALGALLEHANVRLPLRLDALLSLVVTWPHMHKVHHSRDARLGHTNYGNLVSWWDRLFGTFTPSREGVKVAYGLDEAHAEAAPARAR